MSVNAGTIAAYLNLNTEKFNKGLKDAENETSRFSEGISKIGKTIAGAVAAAGIGKAIAASITEGGALEQSIGGIETLFKENADTVRKYANEAYKTVGVGANEYMENVTSFSASLLQSMGGDTAAAAEKANMAMVDMGDNANKMGTAMRDIQNAYQGFAKQNYTMLDNLKLGYGGTKTEMERLLADATKLSGIEYNIENLDDVYSAIHVVQQELGITGTTALEAEETITGSLNALKAAFKDTLGNLALGEDIGPSLQALAETTSTFFFNNFLPMLWNILKEIPNMLRIIGREAFEHLSEQANIFFGKFSNETQNALSSAKKYIEPIIEIAKRLGDRFMQLWEDVLKPYINEFINMLKELYEENKDKIDLVIELFDAFVGYLETYVFPIWEALVNTIRQNFDHIKKVIQAALDIIEGVITIFIGLFTADWEKLKEGISIIWSAMWTGLFNIVEGAWGLLSGAFDAVWGSIKQWFDDLVEAGTGWGADIVRGLWSGISSLSDWVKDKVKGFVEGIGSTIKNFFGISSPSRLMYDYGQFIDEGLAAGIENNKKKPLSAVENMTKAVGEAMSKISNYVKTTSSIIEKEFKLWQLQNEGMADSSKEFEMQMAAQAEQHKILTEQVEVANKALKDITDIYGEGSSEALAYKNELLDLQLQHASLAKEINNTADAYNNMAGAAIKAQIEAYDKQSDSQKNSQRAQHQKEKENYYNHFKDEIDAISRTENVDLGVAQEKHRNKLLGYAKGTNFHPGGLSWVGEQGPEIIDVPRGSKIYTNEQSKGLVDKGRQIIQNINITSPKALSEREVARQTKKATKLILEF